MPETDKKDQTESKKKSKEDQWSWGFVLLMLFIGIFYVPIMWLTEKIKGGGVGFGPAFASFVAATTLVLGTVVIAVGGVLLALGIHFWGH